MKRRNFCQAAVLIPATNIILPTKSEAQAADKANEAKKASKPAVPKAQAKSGTIRQGISAKEADGMTYSDMSKPSGKSVVAGGPAEKTDSKPYQMPLTQEEQDMLGGSKGPEMAKLMKILVAHGNAFGADKLVKLGGRPHSSMYFGTEYMASLIGIFDEVAKAGLKSYAPYTVNPRPYDAYNVNNNPTDMQLIYEGYARQRDVDWVHVRLGSPDLNYRSCACYVPEIGNAPKPGTYVAWAESSAVNYGNSALGLRTNRNATGMELLCAIVGKAPRFGLMTDEGRKAKWLIDVKTSKEPDWGVIGTAIGRKCVEDVPFIAGLDSYFGGKITNENMHKLKAMGSATASSGAVGLYHVEGVTPDAQQHERKLLLDGYQTYVIDDAEQERIRDTFENQWTKKDHAPTHCFIGCPHNTYDEILQWGTNVTKALEKNGKKEAAIPVYLFCANVVRDHLVEEHPELVGRMKQAGMKFTNMCSVSYAGMKGFSERVFGVTNSAKTRNYSTLRYFPDDVLLEIIVTGEIPKNA
ncbi:aconitase X [Microbulbifer agarilyticus]|uniref:aconitase X n=1 Tax=Microbulbifer agarilyticus TaxID=260552 RepID=UPI001CD33DFC|nr:aconitase X [Microbulbifer agarilyticus]MCA0891919.1 aconitase X catalytic domain-containing protein [Microbulbifer agarilyticus]